MRSAEAWIDLLARNQYLAVAGSKHKVLRIDCFDSMHRASTVRMRFCLTAPNCYVVNGIKVVIDDGIPVTKLDNLKLQEVIVKGGSLQMPM